MGKDRRAYFQEYYRKHKQHIDEKQKRWKEKNRKHYLKYQQEYYAENRERISQRKKLKYQESKRQQWQQEGSGEGLQALPRVSSQVAVK